MESMKVVSTFTNEVSNLIVSFMQLIEKIQKQLKMCQYTTEMT